MIIILLFLPCRIQACEGGNTFPAQQVSHLRTNVSQPLVLQSTKSCSGCHSFYAALYDLYQYTITGCGIQFINKITEFFIIEWTPACTRALKTKDRT